MKFILAPFLFSLLIVAVPTTRWVESRSAAGPATETNKVAKGVWGGNHIIMEVTDLGAKIEYDCAYGTIDETIELDDHGYFEVAGKHTRRRAGPARSDQKPDRHDARYTGRVEGNRMTVTVTLTASRETVGTFSLKFGERPELTRCL